jgi:hypothetical protein
VAAAPGLTATIPPPSDRAVSLELAVLVSLSVRQLAVARGVTELSPPDWCTTDPSERMSLTGLLHE